MYYYQHRGHTFASLHPDLPLTRLEHPPETPDLFLLSRDPVCSRTAFCVSDPRQLTAELEDITWLDPDRMDAPSHLLPRRIQRLIDARSLRAVNFRHTQWDTVEVILPRALSRRRIHLLAVGDVGGTLLTALKLMGSDCVETIGIHDLNERNTERWVAEMAQVSWPWDYDALPTVESVTAERLFDCDVFLFAASKGIPPVGSDVADVRMAQFEANRAIIESCARHARTAGFQGLFAVLSDPVDLLCKAAWQASNQGPDGQWDGLGLRSEQIQGFGLGVMNARAAALAKQDSRFRSFLEEGRSFGPHGQGLILANSIAHYDDALSRELTRQVVSANLRIRELGFKPYVATALSSSALQLLLTLRPWTARRGLGGCRSVSDPLHPRMK